MSAKRPEFPQRGAARRGGRRPDRRRAPRRGRQRLADPGGRGAAGAGARRRQALCLAARQPPAHLLHRRRARAVRLRRPRPHRRVLPLRRRDRRRRQRQSGQHRRLRQADGALSRLVRLVLSLLRGAQGDPVPHRAFQAHAGAQGVLHQRAGRQRLQRPPHRRPDRADHQPLPVLVRPGAAALHAAKRASRPHAGRGDRQHRLRIRPPARRAGDAGALAGDAAADARDQSPRSWRRSIRSSRRRCSGSANRPERPFAGRGAAWLLCGPRAHSQHKKPRESREDSRSCSDRHRLVRRHPRRDAVALGARATSCTSARSGRTGSPK